MIAAGNIPKYERSNRLIFLLIAAAFSNIGSSYMRFKRGNWLALVNSGILFIAGSLAFVGAFRVRQAIKEAEVQDTEEGNEGEGEAFIVEKIPVSWHCSFVSRSDVFLGVEIVQ